MCGERHHDVTAPIYGLILAGGSSSRMQRDKAALDVSRATVSSIAPLILRADMSPKVFVSVRASQTADPLRAAHPVDRRFASTGEGPDRRHPFRPRRAS